MTAEQRTAFHVLSWGCPLVLLVPPLVPPGRRSKIKASKNQCKKRVRINLTQHFNTNGTRPQFEHRTPVHHGQMKTRHRRRFEIRTHHRPRLRVSLDVTQLAQRLLALGCDLRYQRGTRHRLAHVTIALWYGCHPPGTNTAFSTPGSPSETLQASNNPSSARRTLP